MPAAGHPCCIDVGGGDGVTHTLVVHLSKTATAFAIAVDDAKRSAETRRDIQQQHGIHRHLLQYLRRRQGCWGMPPVLRARLRGRCVKGTCRHPTQHETKNCLPRQKSDKPVSHQESCCSLKPDDRSPSNIFAPEIMVARSTSTTSKANTNFGICKADPNGGTRASGSMVVGPLP